MQDSFSGLGFFLLNLPSVSPRLQTAANIGSQGIFSRRKGVPPDARLLWDLAPALARCMIEKAKVYTVPLGSL